MKDGNLLELEVIQKLIGDASPVGSTHIDDERFHKIKKIGIIADWTVSELFDIYRFHDSEYASESEAGKEAEKYIKKMLIAFQDYAHDKEMEKIEKKHITKSQIQELQNTCEFLESQNFHKATGIIEKYIEGFEFK